MRLVRRSHEEAWQIDLTGAIEQPLDG